MMMQAMFRAGTVAAIMLAGGVAAQTVPPVVPLGANLERFDYPLPVKWHETSSQSVPVPMAFLDVPPGATPNGRTIVLLHGKNFCAATWAHTATALAARGYRVIVPDQIGFCKSSKPTGYQYSFHSLAELTRGLLDAVGAGKVILVGHSTGGILGVRLALLHPARVAQLVLVNPLGLNDTLAQGVPYADLGQLRREEANTSAASIKAYQQRVYYGGDWQPGYDRWVAMLAGQYAGADGDVVRDAQARLSDMIQTQPVAAELPRLRMPVTLIIGQRDLTAFRATAAPAALRGQVQTVPQAAETAVKAIPGARLVRLAGLGHSPQVEAPARFEQSLLDAIER